MKRTGILLFLSSTSYVPWITVHKFRQFHSDQLTDIPFQFMRFHSLLYHIFRRVLIRALFRIFNNALWTDVDSIIVQIVY